jgi:hypothetical protein
LVVPDVVVHRFLLTCIGSQPADCARCAYQLQTPVAPVDLPSGDGRAELTSAAWFHSTQGRKKKHTQLSLYPVSLRTRSCEPPTFRFDLQEFALGIWLAFVYRGRGEAAIATKRRSRRTVMGRANEKQTGSASSAGKYLPDPKDLPDGPTTPPPLFWGGGVTLRKGDRSYTIPERHRDPDCRPGTALWPVQVGAGGAPPADLDGPEPSKVAQTAEVVGRAFTYYKGGGKPMRHGKMVTATGLVGRSSRRYRSPRARGARRKTAYKDKA